jgi:hypothetical protein
MFISSISAIVTIRYNTQAESRANLILYQEQSQQTKTKTKHINTTVNEIARRWMKKLKKVDVACDVSDDVECRLKLGTRPSAEIHYPHKKNCILRLMQEEYKKKKPTESL